MPKTTKDPSNKSEILYVMLTELKNADGLHTSKDAEKILSAFGANVDDKNIIEFNFLLDGQYYEECLYEYNIPLHDGSFTTFYVDKNLGFECAERLPKHYQDIIAKLHKGEVPVGTQSPASQLKSKGH